MNQTSDTAPVLPRHVAIIMDGNGRWAVNQGLQRLEGHRAGLKNIPDVVSHLTDSGIPYVTLFSFSTENWKRPKAEVNGLLKLLAEALEETTRKLDEHNIVIRHLGRLDRLPPFLKTGIGRVLKKTKNNTGGVASFAFDYGGRGEILEAARQAINMGIKADDLNETNFGNLLNSAGMPDVDLVIRTGGEQRLSNFLLWQSAYAELYFTDTLWPDFTDQEIDKALADYARRQRRFGGL